MPVKLLISFDIVPGRESEYEEFLHSTGIPFWRGRPGIVAMRSYRTVIGPGPAVVAEIEFESAQVAMTALLSREYGEVKRRQAEYVTALSSKLLAPSLPTEEAVSVADR